MRGLQILDYEVIGIIEFKDPLMHFAMFSYYDLRIF